MPTGLTTCQRRRWRTVPWQPGLLAWAARVGYRHCTVGWTSSNLQSDPFYRSRGFTPVRYRLHRRIDPRVTWANEALDYGQFPLR